MKRESAEERESGGIAALRVSIPLWAWMVLVGVIIVWGVTPLLVDKFRWYFIDSDHGKFGDLYGFANALFSGVALWGVIVTLILQSRELRQNTEEMGKTADGISKQVMISSMTAQVSVAPMLIKDLELELESVEFFGRFSPSLSGSHAAKKSMELYQDLVGRLSIAINEFEDKGESEGLLSVCLTVAKEDLVKEYGDGGFSWRDVEGMGEELVPVIAERGLDAVEKCREIATKAHGIHVMTFEYVDRMRKLSCRD